MSDKKKNIKKSNITQLVLCVIIIVLINIIGSYVFDRIDLTAEKRYTISPATKKLLKELDDIVFFVVYLEGDFPAGFKRLRNETKEMLDEFRAYSENIQYEFINPSDAKDKKTRFTTYQQLVKKGLQPTDLHVKSKDGSSQKIIFPWALVTFKGRELPLKLLETQIGLAPEAQLNNSIQGLEYKISNVIRKLNVGVKPIIAFIEGHGELSKIDVVDITHSLSEYYEIERVTINGKLNSLADRKKKDSTISGYRNKYNALIIAKPDKKFDVRDAYLIDQFIMRGGKVLWLIDPVFASMDSLQGSYQTIAMANRLNLEDIFFKYGVRLNTDLIMDINALPIPVVTGKIGDQAQQSFLPWYFFPIITPVSKHPIVNNLNAIKTQFVSSIDLVGNENIVKTILLTTSQYSRTVNTPAMISLEILKKEPKQEDFNKQHLPIAVLLEGKFTSAFKNRLTPEYYEKFGKIDIKESPPNKMLFVSDGDIIKNQLHISKGYPLPLGYDQFTGQTFGNKDFILNSINYLLDDSGLISIRSRELKLRLLDKTKVKNSKIYIQLINTALPILLLIVFGVIMSLHRKSKYAKA